MSASRLSSFLSLLLCAVLFSAPAARAQQPLNNATILKMHAAGLSDDIVLATITSSPGQFDTSVDAMIALKRAGIGDKVIAAMVNKGSAGAVAPAITGSNGLPAGVDEIGVYYKDKTGLWVAFNPEIVNFKTGGVLKSLATAGVVKGDVNGHITGATARLDLNSPITVLLYVPEGTAPTEYQLLKLHPNSDSREFRTVTGGIYHVSTGATKDAIEFQPTKIASRVYTFTLPPGSTAGQYGILPPGANTSSNSASGGKIYTFRLVE